MDLLGNYTYNQDYGNGIYRRRILLRRTEHTLYGAIEDTHHGFSVTVTTDGQRVTQLTPGFHRIPFTTCDGAGKPLQNLIAAALTDTPLALLQRAGAQQNCTHLLDLAVLTICHSQTAETEVQYDVAVTDTQDGRNHLTVHRNGQLIHQWLVNSHYEILEPAELAGKPLFIGFSAWANAQFSGIEKEAAFVLQKGNMVSVARMFKLESGKRAIDEHERHVCHTYSPENNAKAVRLADTVKDFSDCPEQLLRFVPTP